MILITGATGNIGQELCHLFAQSQVPVRVMCRRPEQVKRFEHMGLEAVLGDFEDPAKLKQAMQGCEQLFLLAPFGPWQAQYLRLAIDTAAESGIRHVVKISAADANVGSEVPWARANAEGDHYLRSKDIAWTILRPTGFMQNLLEVAPAISNGFFPYMTGEGRVSYIDARDIALVAKAVLTGEGHTNAVYYLTGPEALSAKDIAAKLSASLGREVRETPITAETMGANLRKAGLEEWHVRGILAQYAVIASNHALDVTEEVRRLTGQHPRSFLQFAREYQEYLTQGARDSSAAQ